LLTEQADTGVRPYVIGLMQGPTPVSVLAGD